MITKEQYEALVNVGANIVNSILRVSCLEDAVEWDYDDYCETVECLDDVMTYINNFNMSPSLRNLISYVGEIASDFLSSEDVEAIYSNVIGVLGDSLCVSEQVEEINTFIQLSYKVISTGKDYDKFKDMFNFFEPTALNWVNDNI